VRGAGETNYFTLLNNICLFHKFGLLLISANQYSITMGKFINLEVWNDAKNLAVSVYKTTSNSMISKDFGLCDQLRRAAVSVPSNIAEGDESGSTKKSISYFYISKGSLAEVYTQLVIAFEVNYIDMDTLNDFTAKINSLSSKLRKLIQYREGIIK